MRTLRLICAMTVLAGAALAQEKPAAERGVELAVAGHCNDAMPLLDQAMRDPNTKLDVKRTVSFAGVRCAMLMDRQTDAMSFLAWLQQGYPKDPDVLFLAVHVFSELGQRNSQELMNVAPDSPLVIELNAENFEKQRDLAKAIAEYRILLQRAPNRPGIHYRIGGLLLALPASESNAQEARREFEAELKMNPQSAGAEFYLGELDRQESRPAEAIGHYTRATQINPDFGEAFFGLGRILLDSGKISDAVPPLQSAVKLAPDNPTAHLALATAYQRLGRKDDAAREFALQKSTSEKLNQTTKVLRQNVSGMPVGNPPQ